MIKFLVQTYRMYRLGRAVRLEKKAKQEAFTKAETALDEIAAVLSSGLQVPTADLQAYKEARVAVLEGMDEVTQRHEIYRTRVKYAIDCNIAGEPMPGEEFQTDEASTFH